MLKTFYKNSIINFVLIFVIGLIIWLPNIFLFTKLNSDIFCSNKIILDTGIQELNIFLTFILFYLISIFIIYINSKFNIIENSNQSIGLVFMLLSSLSALDQYNLVSHLAIIPILLSFIFYFNMSEHKKIYEEIFISGLLLGVSVLINPVYIVLIFIPILFLLFYRGFIWREFTLLFLAVSLPISLCLAVLYLFDLQGILLDKFSQDLTPVYCPSIKYKAIKIASSLIISLIAIVVSIYHFAKNTHRRIKTTRALSVFAIVVLLTIISNAIPYKTANLFIVFNFALSFLVINFISTVKSKAFKKLLYIMFILNFICIYVLQFLYYNGLS